MYYTYNKNVLMADTAISIYDGQEFKYIGIDSDLRQ